MKFENFVIVSSQITVNSNNYDIQTYISELLFISLTLTFFTCFKGILSWLQLDYGQVSN